MAVVAGMNSRAMTGVASDSCETRVPWGTLARDPKSRVHGVPASYDWKGVRYEWHAPFDRRGRLALDVERLDTPRPEGLVPPEWTTIEFLATWTRAEVMAKLLEMPVPVWLRANPLAKTALNRLSQVTAPTGSHCRVFTDVDRSAGIAFSCGWVMPVRAESSAAVIHAHIEIGCGPVRVREHGLRRIAP